MKQYNKKVGALNSKTTDDKYCCCSKAFPAGHPTSF